MSSDRKVVVTFLVGGVEIAALTKMPESEIHKEFDGGPGTHDAWVQIEGCTESGDRVPVRHTRVNVLSYLIRPYETPKVQIPRIAQ